MFTTYLFTGLMIISATIAVILAVHNKHWLSGCFSAFTFGLAASIVIPIWNEPSTTGYVMVGMFFLYHGITEHQRVLILSRLTIAPYAEGNCHINKDK